VSAEPAPPAGLRVLAVDDERPALDDLARLLQASPAVAEVALAGGGDEALRLLAEHRFDVVFLDVRMPGLDGLELAVVLSRFAEPPDLVFVSAFEDGAVGAFEHDLHPLDYLMKPVSRARVEQALRRALAGDQGAGAAGGARPPGTRPAGAPSGARATGARVTGARPAGERARAEADQDTGDIIPVEHQRGGATRLLSRSTVLYIKAEGDYVRIHSDSGRFLVRASLSDIEQRWRPHGFVRVHRSYLANLHRALEIRPQLGGGATVVLADGSEVPVARRQVADLRRRLRM
jgi:DNA-binding LytR/AlgR family response regulator